MSTSGYIAHPTLDGFQLSGVSPVDFEISPDQGLITSRLATGRYRKTAFYSGAGLPDVQTVFRWKIEYSKLTVDNDEKYLDFIDWAISRPGLHTFSLWKHTRLSWTVSPNQTEFILPWRVANFFVDFPIEDPLGTWFSPVITTSPIPGIGSTYSIVPVSSSGYDAGNPDAGEVYIDTDLGTRFKVGDALDQFSVLYGKFVPLHNVYLDQEVSRKLVTGKEGRVLILQEI